MSIVQSIRVSLFFIFLFWLIKGIEYYWQLDFVYYGIYPKEPASLIGILTSPFIHGNFEHLASNTPPFFVLFSSLLFFYPKVAKKVVLSIYICTGIGVWLFARDAFHVGASGVIYGLAAFLFFSGIFRKNVQSLTISLGVALAYGGMLYGLFPNNPHVSWESHLIGAVCGIGAAYYFSEEMRNEDNKNKPPKENNHNPTFEGYVNLENENFKYVYEA